MSDINLDLKTILSFLVEGKIVPENVLPTVDTPFSSEILHEMMDAGNDLRYDALSDELFIIQNDGSSLLCPDLSKGMSEVSDWISNYLPEVFIDTDQGGNLRKGDEADACYKLFAIGFVLESFRAEIMRVFDLYDYDNMSSSNKEGSKTFKDALQYYQNLNSNRINAIISAASYKLSTFKEKNESFYTGLLNAEEISELATLSRNIKAIISKYEREQGLNPVDMKGMNKISKLTLIDRRDVEIETLVSKTRVAMLYRISKLTSERIPPVIKSGILQKAEEAANEYVKEKSLTGVIAADAHQKVRRTVVKEAYRAVLKSIKAREIEIYKNDPANYVLKQKS